MVANNIAIACYFALIVGMGFLAMQRTRNNADFAVAGRRLGPVLYSGTLAAVVLGGGSTIGTARLGYEYGISAFWLVFMFGAGILVLSLVFGRKLAGLRVYTVSEMLSKRFGAGSRYISAAVMIAYDLMIAVTATIGIGSVFDVVLDIPRIWAIIFGGGIVVLYSAVGGMWALTLTDIAQFGVMVLGFFVIMLPLTLARVDGVSGLATRLPESFFDPVAIGGGTILTFFLVYFFGILIGQDIWQRAFTARSAKVTVWAGVAAGAICIIFGGAVALMGAAARALLPDLSSSDNALPALTREVMPDGLAGIVLAAILSALMSTASACILAVSTITSFDLLGRSRQASTKKAVNQSRFITLGTGLAVIVIAALVGDVLAALTIAYNVLVGGLFVPIVGALFWKRATTRAALLSMILGTGTVAVFMIRDGLMANAPIYYSLIVSVVTFVLASLVDKHPMGRPDDQPAEVTDTNPEEVRVL